MARAPHRPDKLEALDFWSADDMAIAPTPTAYCMGYTKGLLILYPYRSRDLSPSTLENELRLAIHQTPAIVPRITAPE